MAIKSRTEDLVLQSRKRGCLKANSEAIELDLVDVDLTSSGSSAPASQSARPRRQAWLIIVLMPATRTLHLNTCRAVTPLPVVILVLKTALHLAPIHLTAQSTARRQPPARDSLPDDVYRLTPGEEYDPEYPAF